MSLRERINGHLAEAVRLKRLWKKRTEALKAEFLNQKLMVDVIRKEDGLIIIPAFRNIRPALLREVANLDDGYDLEVAPPWCNQKATEEERCEILIKFQRAMAGV